MRIDNVPQNFVLKTKRDIGVSLFFLVQPQSSGLPSFLYNKILLCVDRDEFLPINLLYYTTSSSLFFLTWAFH